MTDLDCKVWLLALKECRVLLYLHKAWLPIPLMSVSQAPFFSACIHFYFTGESPNVIPVCALCLSRNLKAKNVESLFAEIIYLTNKSHLPFPKYFLYLDLLCVTSLHCFLVLYPALQGTRLILQGLVLLPLCSYRPFVPPLRCQILYFVISYCYLYRFLPMYSLSVFMYSRIWTFKWF